MNDFLRITFVRHSKVILVCIVNICFSIGFLAFSYYLNGQSDNLNQQLNTYHIGASRVSGHMKTKKELPGKDTPNGNSGGCDGGCGDTFVSGCEWGCIDSCDCGGCDACDLGGC
ncbi:MAG: hypothetical protein HQK94_02275 [Nitrospirae bacterium]|nr:hypothetical protein [Nitrospirota bacterium]